MSIRIIIIIDKLRKPLRGLEPWAPPAPPRSAPMLVSIMIKFINNLTPI